MYPKTFEEWTYHLSGIGYDMLTLGGVFSCLWLWSNRLNLREALKRVVPRSLRFNLLAFVFDQIAVIFPLSFLVFFLHGLLTSHGFLLLDERHFVSLHPLLVFVLAIFAGDFIAYWRHRFEHSRWLWPSHVMHHSDTEMSWFTVHRFHPINRLTTVVIDYCSLVMLGFPPVAIVLSGIFRHYYGAWVHVSMPWTYGWLGKWLVSPAMHRWHHVREGAGVGSNFASVFAVFDRAFGTFYLPGPCDRPLGVHEVDEDSFVKQLVYPLNVFANACGRRFAKFRQRRFIS